jgi:cytidylate kinase
LTLSRQYGSGGAELAQRLGERLDWQVFDREILSLIARQAHTAEAVLARLDERAVSHFHETFANLILSQAPAQAAFLREMMRVLWALARQGKAILLGRGANWLLDQRFGLRVRVVAPLRQRVEWVARQEGLDAVAAEKRVKDNDAAQQRFIRQVFGRDIDDPVGYDLVLNVAALGREAAEDTALAALRSKLSTQD